MEAQPAQSRPHPPFLEPRSLQPTCHSPPGCARPSGGPPLPSTVLLFKLQLEWLASEAGEYERNVRCTMGSLRCWRFWDYRNRIRMIHPKPSGTGRSPLAPRPADWVMLACSHSDAQFIRWLRSLLHLRGFEIRSSPSFSCIGIASRFCLNEHIRLASCCRGLAL